MLLSVAEVHSVSEKSVSARRCSCFRGGQLFDGRQPLSGTGGACPRLARDVPELLLASSCLAASTAAAYARSPLLHEHVCAAFRRRLLLRPPLVMSNDAPVPISDEEVVALAKAAFNHSRQDISQRGPDAPRDVQQHHTGITIDLGHKNIARLPDEVIDVIRVEIERCDRRTPQRKCRRYDTCLTVLTPQGSPSRTTNSPPSLRDC